ATSHSASRCVSFTARLPWDGPSCSATIQFPIARDVTNSRAPSLQLLRSRPHPLTLDRLPGIAGYTTYLAPVISHPGREGFTNHSVCPCHRAVASTPPRWECRIDQISALHAAFALR